MRVEIKKYIEKYRGLSAPVKASIWFLFCSFLQKGITMITTPIFTRLLSSEEFGQYNVFNSWLSILTVLLTLNLSAGVYTQGLVKYEDDKKVFSSSLQVLNLIIILIWTVIYFAAHTIINELLSLTTTQILLMIVIIWTNAVYAFWASEQRVDYKYKKLVVVTILSSLLNPILGIVLVCFSEDKVTARIIGIAVVQLAVFTGCFVVQMLNGKTIYSKTYWIHAISFNIPLIPHYLSQIILNNSDRIMIGKMVGNSEAGIYSLAYAIALIMTVFSQAMTQTLNPLFYRKIKQKKIKEMDSISYLSFLIIGFATLGLIALAPEAVAIFAPEQYSEAIYCIPPVAIGMMFLFSYEIFGKFAFYYEKTKSIMVMSAFAAILNIVLNYFGIRKFGYIAAAYTTLICYIMFSVFHYILMRKVCRVYLDNVYPMDIKILCAIAISFTALGFVLMATYPHPIIRYSIIVLGLIIALIERDKIIRAVKHLWSLNK